MGNRPALRWVTLDDEDRAVLCEGLWDAFRKIYIRIQQPRWENPRRLGNYLPPIDLKQNFDLTLPQVVRALRKIGFDKWFIDAVKERYEKGLAEFGRPKRFSRKTAESRLQDIWLDLFRTHFNNRITLKSFLTYGSPDRKEKWAKKLARKKASWDEIKVGDRDIARITARLVSRFREEEYGETTDEKGTLVDNILKKLHRPAFWERK